MIRHNKKVGITYLNEKQKFQPKHKYYRLSNLMDSKNYTEKQKYKSLNLSNDGVSIG